MSNITATTDGVSFDAADLPKSGQDFTLQNDSDTEPAYVRFGGGDAVVQENFRIGPGESVSAEDDLPNQMMLNASKGINAITAANTAILILDKGE